MAELRTYICDRCTEHISPAGLTPKNQHINVDKTQFNLVRLDPVHDRCADLCGNCIESLNKWQR